MAEGGVVLAFVGATDLNRSLSAIDKAWKLKKCKHTMKLKTSTHTSTA